MDLSIWALVPYSGEDAGNNPDAPVMAPISEYWFSLLGDAHMLSERSVFCERDK